MSLHLSTPIAASEASSSEAERPRKPSVPHITDSLATLLGESPQGEVGLSLPPELQPNRMALMDLWSEALKRLEKELPTSGFYTWIRPLYPKGLNSESRRITLLAPSGFTREYVLKHYKAAVEQVLSGLLAYKVALVIEVGEAPLLGEALQQAAAMGVGEADLQQANQDADALIAMQALNTQPAPANTAWTPRSTQAKLNPRYTFEQFVSGQGNRFCYAAAQQIAQQPGIAYNPFFIHGGVGLGKTHLAQAIGHYLLRHQPNLRVLYTTAEEFTNDLIYAISARKLDPFRDKYRKIDVLIMDDVQFFEGKEKTQEELFHTFNALHQHSKQIVLTSDRPPKELSNLQERLVSRFEWGLLAHAELPDVETRKAILRKKAEREGMTLRFHLDDAVLHFLATTFHANIRELEGAFNKLTAQCLLLEKSFSLEEAQRLFDKESHALQLTETGILNAVCQQANLASEVLLGASRSKEVSLTRALLMYLLRERLQWSFPQIGRFVGNRKHSTVLYNYDKFKEELLKQPALVERLQQLNL